jgi:integrase/recombinase XerD
MSARLITEEDERRAEAIEDFFKSLDSPSTSRTYRSALTTVTKLFPEEGGDLATFRWELAADAVIYEEIRRRLLATVSPNTAARNLAAVRGLLRFLGRRDLADLNRLFATLDAAPKVRAYSKTPPRGVTTDEVKAMLRCCRRDPNTHKGARDAAVLAMLAGTGARRAELATAEMRNVSLQEGTVDLSVKGGGWRRTALNAATTAYLGDWLALHSSGPLFCHVVKNGIVLGDQPLSDKAIWRTVVQRRDEAQLDDRITPHSFRRWFVTTLLESGADVFTVAGAVGHSNPLTTQKYDRRGDEALRAAVTKLPLPTLEEVDEMQ